MLKNDSHNSIISLLGILLVSFSLSSLSILLITNVLANNFAEIFLVPGIILILLSEKEIYVAVIKSLFGLRFITILFFIFVFFLLGLFTGKSIAYCYSDFRAIVPFMYFLVINGISKDAQKGIAGIIYKVFTFTTLFDLIFLLISKDIQSYDSRYIVMTICPFVISIVSLNKGKILYSGIFLFILIYESIVSSLRYNYILIFLYAFYLICYLIYSVKKRRKYLWKLLVYLITIVALLFYLAPDISSFIMENGSRYFHTIVRSKSAIENPIEAETVRINTTLVFIKEPLKLALPQGLGWRNHIERVQSLFSDYGIRSTMDSSIFYCVYHFGLVLGLVFLFYILCYFIGLLIRIKELNRLIDFMAEIVFFLAFIILFFLKSWMFTYLNVSIVYSLLILMIRYPDIYIELRKN